MNHTPEEQILRARASDVKNRRALEILRQGSPERAASSASSART
jgi:hypothetical protein